MKNVEVPREDQIISDGRGLSRGFILWNLGKTFRDGVRVVHNKSVNKKIGTRVLFATTGVVGEADRVLAIQLETTVEDRTQV